MNAYPYHPAVPARIATPFFAEYVTRCDDPDAFDVLECNDRITSIAARPDALVELWSGCAPHRRSRNSAAGIDSHVIASATRTCALLTSDVGDLRHDAYLHAKSLSRAAASSKAQMAPV
jgi:hypothetical protein